MIGALPEGIAAGDYTTAAEDKPALAVTDARSKSWGGNDLSALPRHCDGLVVGVDRRRPAPVGGRQLPATRCSRIPRQCSTFRCAVKSGEVTAAWTTTADPNVPADLVVLTDGKPALVQAENVVPLYRRNALTDRQLLAVNEVAGVLDTAALVDMRRQVTAGADPQAVADAWLNEHPLGALAPALTYRPRAWGSGTANAAWTWNCAGRAPRRRQRDGRLHPADHGGNSRW